MAAAKVATQQHDAVRHQQYNLRPLLLCGLDEGRGVPAESSVLLHSALLQQLSLFVMEGQPGTGRRMGRGGLAAGSLQDADGERLLVHPLVLFAAVQQEAVIPSRSYTPPRQLMVPGQAVRGSSDHYVSGNNV